VDRPDQLEYLNLGKSAEYGVDFAPLHVFAVNKLRHRLLPIQRHEQASTFMRRADGNFESSLLLLGGLWDETAKSVSGELVVCVPSRDTIMFSSSHSEGRPAALRVDVDRIWVNGERLDSQH
jgi:uncharacterized protein YtpQ (UPF0354 family)